MSEKLAYVGQIVALDVIANADRLLSAIVECGEGGKWQGVVAKDDFKAGDLCEVYLQDSIVPKEPRFAFMEVRRYRVRICRFRGTLSEALIMPLTLIGDWAVGTDVTNDLGVIKYERPLPGEMAGIAKGNFPSFLHKTDEPNVQRSQAMVEALKGHPYVVTLKLDGSSATFYKYNGVFGACSRRLDLSPEGESVFWKMARKLGLEDIPDGYAVQGELVGPSVQGNPLGLKEPTVLAFNVFSIEPGCYLDHEAAIQFLADFVPAMRWVPVVEMGPEFTGFDAVENLQYPNKRAAEGVVIRPQTERMVGHERLSFKIINPLYKES